MKRTLFFMLLSALLWGGGATTFAAARLPYDFEHGGMYYYISYVDEVTLVSGDVKYSGNVSIPDTIVQDGKNYRITAIGDYAFDGCSNLTEITIPETVKEIGESAFHDCELLITVTIPGSVTTIGNDAFWSCDKLTQVILNTGLQTIGSEAFITCPRLRSVTIPNSVTTIGSLAFSSCSSLQEVTIGTGVKTIGDRAFNGCSNLKAVHIADLLFWYLIDFQVSSLAPENFSSNPLYYAKELYLDNMPVTELNIPEEITSIGKAAFYNCTSLTSVKIPATVTKIGRSAFENCTGLRTADIAAETIDDFAFRSSSNLQTLTLNETTKNIGNQSFRYCKALKEVTIPTNATIGEAVFETCTDLKTVTLNEGIKTIPASAFSVCPNLTYIKLPESVTTIGVNAFARTGLTSVTMGSHVETIADGAFKEISTLKSITIPESVKKIGSEAFPVDSICITNLKAWCEIEFGERSYTLRNSHLYWNGQLVTNLTIPAGITEIKNYAFRGWKDLKSLVIPAGVTRIGKEAFADCSSLKSLQMGEDVEFIGEKAFYNCANLQSLTMPDAVTEVGWYAFSGCTELKAVKISENLETVNDQTFYGCASIDSIKIPDNTRSIGGSAFYGCSSLKSVKLGKGLRTIGKSVFRSCTSLDSITIPDNVTTIDDETFRGCTNLKSVKIGKGIELISSYLFDSCRKLKLVEIGGNVTRIGGNAFNTCTSLASITLPASVTEIGYSAFANCDSLTTITGPRVISIGSSAFSECKSLTSVKMDRIENIEYEAFSHCISLASITLPKSITNIGRDAFYNCTGLTSVKVYNPKPITVSNPFSGVDCAHDTLYVPAGSIAAYQAAEVWNTFGTILSISDPVSKNFTPTTVSPADSAKVTELAKFTLVFDEKPNLVKKTATLAKGEDSYAATLAAGEGDTLVITLDDTLKVAGEYTLTIPEGTFGDDAFAVNSATGHCNPQLTYTYYVVDILPELVKDFAPTDVTPADSSEVMKLSKFTLLFGEKTVLVGDSATLMKADSSAYFPADIVASSDSTLTITLTDTVVTESGDYLLTIAEGTFGDATFAGNQTAGRCNPALTYVYYIEEDTVPEVPELVKDFMPMTVTPADSAQVTKLAEFRLLFDEKPVLVVDSATLMKADSSAYFPADIVVSSDSTLMITLTDTVVTESGDYLLTIPEGAFGNEIYFDNPTTGRCNPELTYTYCVINILPEATKDFMPMTVTPADSAEVTELAEFTLLFDEKPFLVGDSATLMKADSSAYFPAGIVASSDSTLTITLTDTVVTESGNYLLTIPEGAFGNEIYFDDSTAGRCNPELTYVYTIKEDTVPEVPELVKDFMPMTVTPTDSAEVTELAEFTLLFDEKPYLVGDSATLMKADSSAYFPAGIVASSDSTLTITLTDTVVTESGNYLLTIPEGTFGDDAFAADSTTGHCNPALTYTYYIVEDTVPELAKDFMPTDVTPADSAEVTELAEFTLLFDEKPYLVGDSATLMKADSSAYFPAGIVVSSDSTLTITLTDTVVTESGNYLLTIPEGIFGDDAFAADSTTGHCNPALTYTYYIVEDTVPELAKDFMPKRITPSDSAQVTELAEFTLLFDEKLVLVGDSATLMKADSSAYFPAGIVASSDSTLTITLTDTVVTESGNYLLTIPEGIFGDDAFAADSTTGHCNPALTYTYYIVEDTVPDEPVKPELVKDFMPTDVTPTDSAEVTELWQFTLTFDTKPLLISNNAMLENKAGSIFCLAEITEGEGNTLVVRLKSNALTIADTYKLTIPEGAFGDEIYFDDQTTGHCNPALTYVYTIKEDTVPDEPETPEMKMDFIPATVTPTDSTEVTELWQFTLTFDTKPVLIYNNAMLQNKAGTIFCLAEITEGEGNTLVVRLKSNALTIAGTYTLTIYESSFGDAAFAADQTTGHCNPELVYTYTINGTDALSEIRQADEHIAVYNLQGVLILETNDADDLKTLQKGAYIVNGKKMIIAR